MEKDIILKEWVDCETIEYISDGNNSEKNETKQNSTEEIIVESEESTSLQGTVRKFTFKDILTSARCYLKKNWIFLLVISIIWIITGAEDYLMPLFNTPIIGRPLTRIALFLSTGALGTILRFFTATYNGPVWKLTPYTFLVAITAKSVYILSMTEVVFPAIKELISNKNNALSQYKSIIFKVQSISKSFVKSKNKLGLMLYGTGFALIISNFLSRNGKIDKSFVLILLSFVAFKGLNNELQSSVDFILRKLLQFITLILPSGIKNAAKNYELVRVGFAAGFILAVVVGNFGEKAGYVTGVIAALAGIVLSLLHKENITNDN